MMHQRRDGRCARQSHCHKRQDQGKLVIARLRQNLADQARSA